jgi:hypothetical protein
MSYKDENGRYPHMNLTCNLEIKDCHAMIIYTIVKTQFFILQDMEVLLMIQ